MYKYIVYMCVSLLVGMERGDERALRRNNFFTSFVIPQMAVVCFFRLGVLISGNRALACFY